MKNIFVILKNEERAWVSAIDYVPEDDYIIFITLPGPNNSKEAQDKALVRIRKEKAYLEYGKMIPKTNDENLALVDRMVQYQEGERVTFDVETKKKIAIKIIETIEKKGSKTETTVHLIGKARNTYSGDLLKVYNRRIYSTLHKALNETYGMQIEEPAETEQAVPKQEKAEQATKQEKTVQPGTKEKKNKKPSGGMRMQTHVSGLHRGKNDTPQQDNSPNHNNNPCYDNVPKRDANSHRDDKQEGQSERSAKREFSPKGAGKENTTATQFKTVEDFEQWRENIGQSQDKGQGENEPSSQKSATQQSKSSARQNAETNHTKEKRQEPAQKRKSSSKGENVFFPDVTLTESPFPLLPPEENLIEGDHKKLDTFLLGNTSDRTPEIKSAENLLMLRYLEKFRDLFSTLLENNPISVDFYIRDWHRIIDLAYRAEDENDFLESVSTLYNAIRIPVISPDVYARLKYHAQRYIDVCSIVYKQIERP